MSVTYKDIDQLSQKSSVAGTEKLPVSDTQYITPAQIAASVPVDASLSSSSTNAIQNKAVGTEFGKVVYLGDSDESVEPIENTTIEGITMNGSPVSVVGGVADLGTVITDISGKQDVISDLATIRSGAASGATAYQKPSTGIPASDMASGVIPSVPTNVSSFTNDVGYAKYVLLADEAAYTALATKDSGTLYLIPKTS